MMHRSRLTKLQPEPVALEDLRTLAERLTVEHFDIFQSFALPSGIRFLINDSTGCEPNVVQEYAVYLRTADGSRVMIESITASWCKPGNLYRHLLRIEAGALDAERYPEWEI